LGYEPNELPLLHPASLLRLLERTDYSIPTCIGQGAITND